MNLFGDDGDLGLITIAAFLFFALLVGAGLMAALGQGSVADRKNNRRIQTLRQRGHARGGAESGPAGNIKLEEATSRIPGMDMLAAKFLPRRDSLAIRLSRTGKKLSVGTYGLICVVTGLVVAVIELKVFKFPPAPALLAAVAASVGLPHLVVNYLINRRVMQFMAQFPEAIELIVRGIKSGLPVTEEIGVVGREMADPVGTEFARISDALRFGQTLEDAMWDTARRLGIPEFNFFVISLSVQRETGGNLAETLENLADILRRRRQMKLKIKAVSSEARASAYIIGSLPFIMAGILCLTAPVYVAVLLDDPRGNLMAGGALALQGIGVLIMAKMVQFEI
jgi:tight adherence protein B